MVTSIYFKELFKCLEGVEFILKMYLVISCIWKYIFHLIVFVYHICFFLFRLICNMEMCLGARCFSQHFIERIMHLSAQLESSGFQLRLHIRIFQELLKIFILRLYPKPIYISIPGARIRALVPFKAPHAISVCSQGGEPLLQNKGRSSISSDLIAHNIRA